VDVATVSGGKVQAIEIKWTSQLRKQDVKVIGGMPNAEVWANVSKPHDMNGLPIKPLPQALFDLTP